MTDVQLCIHCGPMSLKQTEKRDQLEMEKIKNNILTNIRIKLGMLEKNLLLMIFNRKVTALRTVHVNG